MKIGFTIDQTPGGPTFKRKNDRMNEINFSASWLSDVEPFLFQAAPQYPKKRKGKIQWNEIENWNLPQVVRGGNWTLLSLQRVKKKKILLVISVLI